MGWINTIKMITGQKDSIKNDYMADICVVLPCNTIWAPYYFKYEKILIDNGINFDLILWNRNIEEEDVAARLISYELRDATNNGDSKKVVKFLKFSKFVKKTIIRNKYKKLIFLGTYAGNCVLIRNYLNRHYCNAYWLDIRDHTYENISLYRRMVGNAVSNSYKTVISSYAFKSFLPGNIEYLIGHNIDYLGIKESKRLEYKKTDDVIRISYIGSFSQLYYNENIKFINFMANDSRFQLQYFGVGLECLKMYCENNGIQNVVFEGRFSRKEMGRIYSNTDIINNLYGITSYNLKLALSNKFYFSLALERPILVCAGTEMARITKKSGNGFIMDYSYGCKDKLHKWYSNFDGSMCKAAFARYCMEDELFKEELLRYLDS